MEETWQLLKHLTSCVGGGFERAEKDQLQRLTARKMFSSEHQKRTTSLVRSSGNRLPSHAYDQQDMRPVMWNGDQLLQGARLYAS